MGKGVFTPDKMASLAMKVPAVRPSSNQLESNQRHNARQCVMKTIDFMMKNPMSAKDIWSSIDSGAVVSEPQGQGGSSTDTPQKTPKATTFGSMGINWKASVYLA